MAAYPVSDAGVVSSDQLVLPAAVAAYLGRYRGQTRLHTNSDLRIFLRWCDEHGLSSVLGTLTLFVHEAKQPEPEEAGDRAGHVQAGADHYEP
jgi:hypothetical protein